MRHNKEYKLKNNQEQKPDKDKEIILEELKPVETFSYSDKYNRVMSIKSSVEENIALYNDLVDELIDVKKDLGLDVQVPPKKLTLKEQNGSVEN
jgi:hypothetical protein